MTITAEDIFAKERVASGNWLILHHLSLSSNPAHMMELHAAFLIFQSWANVADAVRAGVDPVVAVLQREL